MPAASDRNPSRLLQRLAPWAVRVGVCLLVILVLLVVLAVMASGMRQGVIAKSQWQEPDAAVAQAYEKKRRAFIDRQARVAVYQPVDYTQGPAASWWPTGQSPLMDQLEAAGDLPPVEQRVGPEPVVYQGVVDGGPANYGGDWWRLAADIDEVRLALQYELKNNQLVRFGPLGEEVHPHLAKSVTPSEGYRVWTVTLRKGVCWSDGHPFTAEDILWWWRSVKNEPDVGFIDETMKVQGLPGDIERVDDHTLRFVFPLPHPGWLKAQASAAGALYMAGPRHYLQRYHPIQGDQQLIEELCEARVLTPRQLFHEMNHPLNPERPKLGPWLFRTYQSNGPWTAVRNPYYFAVDAQGNQLPYIDRLIFTQISEQMRAQAVTDGVASLMLNPEGNYTSLMSQREAGDYGILHWPSASRGAMTIVPNRRLPYRDDQVALKQKAQLLADPRFREALSLAVDRESIISAVMRGIGEPAHLGPPPGYPWHDPATARAAFDPQRANAILDGLGLTRRDSDGFRMLPGQDGQPERLLLSLIARPNGAEPLLFLVTDWAQVGLRIVVQEKPHRLFLRSQRYADLISTGEAGSELDWQALGAGAPYWDWYHAGGLTGQAQLEPGTAIPDEIEKQAMQLGQAAGDAVDPAERARLAKEVLAIAREQHWTINVSYPAPSLVMVKDGLRGVPEMVLSSFMLNTPNNAYPETWYWADPETINGAQAAPADYLAARTQSILGELRVARPKPNVAVVANADGQVAVPAADGLGRVLWLTLVGIVVVSLALLAFRHPFVLRRLLIMIPTLTVISIIVYIGVQLPPGSYLDTVLDNLEQAGQREQAQAEVKVLREMHHLDEHPVVNYFRWTGLLWFTSFDSDDRGLLQGSLGRSMANDGAFVSDLLGDRLLLTFTISFGTIIMTWIIGLPIGLYSAVRQYSVADYTLTIVGFIGMCIPNFILALLLMLLAKEMFDLTILGLFSNQYAMQDHWDWPKVWDMLQRIWVPIVVVGTAGTAGMIRIMRANLLDELKKPYVTTARAKGVRPVRLLLKYPLRMALNPFVVQIGNLFPVLISGSAIVAIVLSLPTTGPLLLSSVMLEDTYMAGSLLMVLSALSVFGILVSDLLLLLVDPRIRMESGGSR